MFRFILSLSIFFIISPSLIQAQDTLPRVSVKQISNKVIVSWKNTYGAKINNINIQRSNDSLKNFTTIGSVLNPMSRENGYVDNKASQQKKFYRVFVAFDGGDYFFTRSARPVTDTVEAFIESEIFTETKLPANSAFVPSKFVYTGKDNNIIINLPNAETRKLSIQFFDEKDNPLFEIKKITESFLIIEKVNFLYAGWFKYHLSDNGILLEKHKFLIPRDVKLANGREQKER